MLRVRRSVRGQEEQEQEEQEQEDIGLCMFMTQWLYEWVQSNRFYRCLGVTSI